VDVWGRQAINLLVFTILANLLLPADFGLVALAAVFVAFAQLFIDQGLGDALVQRKTLTRNQIDTAFWVAVATALALTVVMFLAAQPLSVLLGQPDLAPVLQVLSLAILFAAFSTIQMDLLRRELAFKLLAVRSLAAATAGGVAGVAAALMGYGAWALVIQQLTSAAASVLALWWVTAWRPGLRFSTADFRELFSFGVNVVGSDLVAFLSRYADKLLVGAVLGVTQLGFYTVAFRLLDTSQAMLINIGRKIAFPALSAVHDDPQRMQRAYLRGSRVSSALTLPAFLGLAAISPELVVVLFGNQWAEAGRVSALLFLVGPAFTLQAFSHVLFMAVGRPDVGFRFRLWLMVVSLAAFVVAVNFGIVAVAVAFVAASYLLLPLNLRWQRVYGGVPTLTFLNQLRGAALATGAMLLAIVALKMAVGSALGQAMLLAAEVVVGAVVYAVGLWLFDRPLLVDAFAFAAKAVPGGERMTRRAGS
jgi:PST family polysaccharide transporter